MTKNKKILSGILVLIAVSGFFIYKMNKKETFKETEFQVLKSQIDQQILSTGTVQPKNRLAIKSPVAGRLEQVIAREGQKVSKGQILAWISSTERAALIDAARAQGADEVKKWEELYKPTPIVAPLAGQIILRGFESGQTVTVSDAIFVMADRLTVKAQVDETDIAKIKLKMKAEIVLDAYPEDKIGAQVDQIAYESKTVSNVTSYLVDVLPEKIYDKMRSGMTANVTFFLGNKENLLIIPNEVIQFQNGKSVVKIKNAEGKFEDKEIKTGITDGKKTEILSGLNEGDKIYLVLSVKDLNNQKSLFGGPQRPSGRNSGGGMKH